MDQQPTVKDKQQIFRRDCLFSCSMFVVLGIFVLSLIAAPFWEFDQRQKVISARGTATGFAASTQQANATATIVARATEQGQYKFIDRFNNNAELWSTESIDDEYLVGSTTIKGGIYVWDISEVKQPFVHWENFRKGYWFKDFDIYVDSKVKTENGTPIDVCSGFVFRASTFYLEEGAYAFLVCNNSYFHVDYYKRGEWEAISNRRYSNTLRNPDWNRLEISARGNHFTFIINNEVVFEMTDDRLPKGGVGLLVEVNEEKPVSIWFDNFGVQRR